ncbi:hypothetical protein EJ419_05480 [Alloscardovia theropitheci]|uniref:Uncharacterized protein n=1 Tax=Alloscardovia theropitheci TaxID=2496842 RepID=A0A4R0QZL5_9BIFI|nr:hypothetical protein [Alloscardovia theropitheci]TCD54106.1 hypothetical protein EJ419_05480 [Alloscardovia theropitheci]
MADMNTNTNTTGLSSSDTEFVSRALWQMGLLSHCYRWQSTTGENASTLLSMVFNRVLTLITPEDMDEVRRGFSPTGTNFQAWVLTIARNIVHEVQRDVLTMGTGRNSSLSFASLDSIPGAGDVLITRLESLASHGREHDDLVALLAHELTVSRSDSLIDQTQSWLDTIGEAYKKYYSAREWSRLVRLMQTYQNKPMMDTVKTCITTCFHSHVVSETQLQALHTTYVSESQRLKLQRTHHM